MSVIKLIEKKKIMLAYLEMKMQEEDWHGVADAAMDLREIEMEIRIYKKSGKIYANK